MLASLSEPALTFLFLGIVGSLGVAVVWAFWEIEQRSKALRPRQLRRPGRDAGCAD